MIAVIVPAHNEEERLPACLASLHTAARCAALGGEAVVVIVVADACTDETEAVAIGAGAQTLSAAFRNVGCARALGAAEALRQGARWLAFTDADTTVAEDWLACQLALAHDAVCGTVAVANWEGYGDAVVSSFDAEYQDRDGHAHIHGANMGVSSEAYRRAGGFPALACSEDVALVDALKASGAAIAWSARPRVFTSARRDYRAAGGFGAAVEKLAAKLQAAETEAAR